MAKVRQTITEPYFVLGRPPRLTREMAEKIATEYVRGKEIGDKIPSIRKLAELYNVDNSTITNALGFLKRNRSVYSLPGKGYFVAGERSKVFQPFAGKSVFVAYGQVAPRYFSSYHTSAAGGIVESLAGTEINVTLKPRDWRQEQSIPPATHCHWKSVAGIFFIGLQPNEVLTSLQSIQKPMTAIDWDATADDIHSFCFDDVGAGKLLAERLLKLGHREFAAIVESPTRTAKERDQNWDARKQGFVDCLKENQISVPKTILLNNRTPSKDTTQQLIHILQQPNRPTAIFAPSPSFVSVCRKAAAHCKLEIPRDLSVMTFFDVWPEDTTNSGIHMDVFQLAGWATHRMMDHWAGFDPLEPPATRFDLSCRFHAGETHAAAPKVQ